MRDSEHKVLLNDHCAAIGLFQVFETFESKGYKEMPLFILSILVQVGFAVHAVKTGRDSKWLYFILLFPLVGCIVYLIVEVLPDLQGARAVRRANRIVMDKIDPDRDVRNSAENLEQLRSIDNLVDYASHCLDRGHYDEAIRVYRSSLKGIYEFDAKLLLGLAEALFAKSESEETISNYEETIKTLDVLIQQHPDFKSADGHMLYARSLEKVGKIDEALHEYESLAQYFTGPEAKCRYALLLKRVGKTSLAQSLFQDIRLTAKRSPKHYSQMHKEWIDIAYREQY